MNLTSRDKDTLLWIWLLEYLTTSQYAELFCDGIKNGIKVARRRLNILAENGYLNYFLSLKREHVFLINKSRINEIQDLLGDSVQGIIPRTSEPKNPIFLNHHLSINEFIICLKLACDKTEYSFSFIPEYRSSQSGRKLEKYIAEYIPGNSQKDYLFIPDCVFCMENSQNKKALFFLEADMGNSTLMSSTFNKKDMACKLKAYARYLQIGAFKRYCEEFKFEFKGFRILIPTSSEERLNNILHLCDSDMAWLTTWDKISPDIIFSRIWKTRTPDGYALKAIVNNTGDKA